MRRALRKRRVFDFVPSYLKRFHFYSRSHMHISVHVTSVVTENNPVLRLGIVWIVHQRGSTDTQRRVIKMSDLQYILQPKNIVEKVIPLEMI